LLQSGNVVFRGAAKAPARLEVQLEAALEKRLGFNVEFHVRTADEWRDVVDANPFRAEAKKDPGHLLVSCFKGPLDKANVKALQAPDALWAFVTSPGPMYLERRAAATQAKGLVPVAWLPKIWQAVGELRREQRLHQFGLKPHPLSSIAWIPRGQPASPGPREIL